MAAAVDRWRANRAALAELALDPRELARRLEIHEHEAAEISAARLRPGEATEIRARLEAAQHGEAIARGSATIHESLAADEGGARDAVAIGLREARTLARIDGRFEPLAERIAGLEAELADLAATARELAESVDHDPAEIARLEERLSTIYALERRYGDDEGAVIAHGERAAEEALRLRGLDADRETRQAEEARLLEAIGSAGEALSTARALAGRGLATEVGTVLEELGFPSGVFEVVLGRRPAGKDEPAVEIGGDALAFDASGIDEVVYRLAPNPGEPARPLAKIASGGEMSRVALAIKQVLAAADATPTLVFDEIDAGIGGRSADPIGRSLWTLARRHQVLCVTHLPQIAAHADAHFQIVKRERDGRTITEVTQLDREGRIVELGQMLGGAGGGTAALASARELVDRADAWRGDVLASS
jgi:DNA repair protein RecN (Recombination protein N)